MDNEFTEYEALMRELSEFIQESATHWASCDRLKLQLDHAQNQLAELRVKFEAFKHPIQFSKKLEKMERDLRFLCTREINFETLNLVMLKTFWTT